MLYSGMLMGVTAKRCILQIIDEDANCRFMWVNMVTEAEGLESGAMENAEDSVLVGRGI